MVDESDVQMLVRAENVEDGEAVISADGACDGICEGHGFALIPRAGVASWLNQVRYFVINQRGG